MRELAAVSEGRHSTNCTKGIIKPVALVYSDMAVIPTVQLSGEILQRGPLNQTLVHRVSIFSFRGSQAIVSELPSTVKWIGAKRRLRLFDFSKLDSKICIGRH